MQRKLAESGGILQLERLNLEARAPANINPNHFGLACATSHMVTRLILGSRAKFHLEISLTLQVHYLELSVQTISIGTRAES